MGKIAAPRITVRYKTWSKLYVPGPVKRTQFKELAYQKRGDHWRILDINGMRGNLGDAPGIGPYYPSESSLLHDLNRYAMSYGCSLA